jgi:hypothetical protein
MAISQLTKSEQGLNAVAKSASLAEAGNGSSQLGAGGFVSAFSWPAAGQQHFLWAGTQTRHSAQTPAATHCRGGPTLTVTCVAAIATLESIQTNAATSINNLNFVETPTAISTRHTQQPRQCGAHEQLSSGLISQAPTSTVE